MTRKGDSWNESEVYRDSVTLRRIRKITSSGVYNYHPAYHINTAWTADGKTFVFHSGRNGKTAIFACETDTGDIRQLTEWIDGWSVGALPGADRNFEKGIDSICLDKMSGWVYYTCKHSLKAVHIESLQEKTLVENGGDFAYGLPTVSPDGQYVAVPANIIPAQFDHMDPARSFGFREVCDIYGAPGGSRMRLIRIPTSGTGDPEVVYDETDCRGNHLQFSPVDPDLLHTDRDFAPKFWGGSDGVRNRVWLYRISTGELVEQPSPSGRTFQVHSTWSFDGTEVLYHCPGGADAGSPGYVIGVNDLEGNNIAEYGDDSWTHYGHVSGVAGRKAIMIDGNITDDLILWLHYDDPARPRVEIICRHGTNWGGHESQFPHPHPQSSPDGGRIVYNAAHRGRSDVFVVEV